MSDLFDATLQGLQIGLDITARRQAVLSSNLANLDTPHYVPKDLEFQEYLRRVTQAAEPSPVAATQADHLTGEERLGAGEDVQLVERADRVPGPDGNAVDLDRQLALAVRNSGRYGALTRAVQMKTAALKYVMSQS